jgi:hypothetical protein
MHIDNQLEFGLEQEERFIQEWGSKEFPDLGFTKHSDIYNAIDCWVTNRRTGKTQSAQIKIIAPRYHYLDIGITKRQWDKYLESVDILYHISPVAYPDKGIDIELRWGRIKDIIPTRVTTKIGTRYHISLLDLKRIPLSEEYQRYLDSEYDKWVRPGEQEGYKTTKKYIK